MGVLGNLFIVSAPSGAGKSTLLSRLIEEDPHIDYSVSHTTRAPRMGEENGIHYHFVDEARFMELVDQGAFLEWARVHGHLYGTSKAPIMKRLEEGQDVIVDIDVVGAGLVREQAPQAIGIFILPPDYQTLEARLVSRGKDSPEVIQRRLKNALGEMQRIDEFHYSIVNDDLDSCFKLLRSIIRASRCKTAANKNNISKIIATFAQEG